MPEVPFSTPNWPKPKAFCKHFTGTAGSFLFFGFIMIPALLWVIIGGFLEPLWVIFLKKANETHSIKWGVCAVVIMILSPMMLALGMGAGLSMGIAYSIWTGIGAVCTVLTGVVLYHDRISVLKVLFMFMIIAGVIGLHLSSGISA